MHVQIGTVPPARPLQHVQLQGEFDFEPTIFFKIMDQSVGRKSNAPTKLARQQCWRATLPGRQM